MKIAPANYRNFCQSIPGSIRSILFYGENESDITPKLTKLIQKGMPYKISEFQIIDAAQLVKKEVFLTDLISSHSLFGPPQPVMIQKATDKLVPIIESYLEDKKMREIIIIISDSYLKPSSKLRQIYEKEEALAVIACYARTVPEVTQNIIEVVTSLDKNIDRMAAQTLAEKIIQGTATLESEIDKIINYVGPDQSSITLKDILDCTTLNIETTEKQIYSAFLRKKWDEIPFLFLEKSREDINEIGVLRGLNSKLLQVLSIKTLLEDGKNMDQASRIVTPPIFFQEKEMMNSAVRIWETKEIKYVLNKLLKIEEAVKYDSGSAGSLLAMTLFSDLIKERLRKN